MNDNSNESNHSSDCTCVFQKAFIGALERLPQLWDPTDINFKNKRKKTEALENLLALQRKSNANATRDLVRRKVHWLISNYRRTLKQLEGAKENGEDFKPKWQFKALQFLHKREGSKDNSQLCDELLIKPDQHNYESDEHTNYETFACACDTRKIFIEALEKLPELWDPTHMHYKNKRKRNAALDSLLAVERNSNPQASKDFVRRKAYWLISNYRRSLKQVENARQTGEVYRPQWQFKALQFLHKRERLKENHTKNDPEPSDEEYEYEYLDLPDDDLPSTTTDPHTPNKRMKIDLDLNGNEDEEASSLGMPVDPIAYVWSEKLRSLDPTQRIFAEKAINDVLFEAQLNNLHRNSVQIIVD